jgi:type 1 glutamine amidotransferase
VGAPLPTDITVARFPVCYTEPNMHRFTRVRAVLATSAMLVVLGAHTPSPAGTPAPKTPVLVFTATTGFRHDSIPAAVDAIERLGTTNRFRVDTTEDPARFTRANLARYHAVIFVSTTGSPLPGTEPRRAFERYIARGGGFVGVHAASDGNYDWPWFGRLVGAYFLTHPPPASATVQVARHDTAATARIPDRWTRFDEWYDFRTNPRPDVRVLATVDESTYQGGGMGADHPIAWCHRVGGGRSVYTAMGHTIDAYAEPLFLDHLLGMIEMATGRARFSCTPGR